MAVLFQFVGLAGSILGLYGFYSDHAILMIIGIVAAVLFCKCNTVSMVEHVLARILIIPLLSLPGMLICHFAANMVWGRSFLLCFIWMLAITSFLFVFSVIRERNVNT